MLFLMITLGFLAAFGPLVTDMYLPALPTMTGYFHTTPSKVQLSLMSSLLGLSLGQLVVGPLSDKFGRKKPLLISLGLFILTTIICIGAWDIYSFVLFRFLQGMAGAGGLVISRSVATDLFSGNELAEFFAMIGAVHGLAPIGSPVIGGALMKVTNWQGIFSVLLLTGILLLLLSFRLYESLSLERRSTRSVLSSFMLFVPVVRNKRFMLYVAAISCSMATLFAYIASSPFILQKTYGLTPLEFSCCFAFNAVGLMAGSLSASRFKRIETAFLLGSTGLFLMSSVTALLLVSNAPFVLFESALFAMLFCAGLIFPTTTTLALDIERRHTGTASAVLGATGFIIGGMVSPIVGMGNIHISTSVVMVFFAMLVLLLSLVSLRKKNHGSNL